MRCCVWHGGRSSALKLSQSQMGLPGCVPSRLQNSRASELFFNKSRGEPTEMPASLPHADAYLGLLLTHAAPSVMTFPSACRLGLPSPRQPLPRALIFLTLSITSRAWGFPLWSGSTPILQKETKREKAG